MSIVRIVVGAWSLLENGNYRYDSIEAISEMMVRDRDKRQAENDPDVDMLDNRSALEVGIQEALDYCNERGLIRTVEIVYAN